MEKDETLIQQARQGHSAAQDELISRYKNLVRLKAAAYYLPGGDREDIVQEGMIGLFKAIRDYDPARQVRFSSFAALCISRQIISAIKASLRLKHAPLNTSFPVEELENAAANPETLFIAREEKAAIEQHIRGALSSLEEAVLALYLQGQSYAEIAHSLGRDAKAIDNTLQRVRRKLGSVRKFI